MRMRSHAKIACLVAVSFLAILLIGSARGGDYGPSKLLADGIVNASLPTLILPQVNFRDADLPGTLEYLRKKAFDQSNGAVKLVFTLDLPEDFHPQSELTLHLANVPLREALHYVGQLAGVQFTSRGNVLVVQKLGGAQTQPPPQTKGSSSSAPVSRYNPLTDGPKRADDGNNSFHSLDGTLQTEKSGFVPHRSMSGVPVAMDPKNGISVDCIKPSACPSPDCGCKQCACKH